MGAEFFEDLKATILKIFDMIKEYLLKLIGEAVEEETTANV